MLESKIKRDINPPLSTQSLGFPAVPDPKSRSIPVGPEPLDAIQRRITEIGDLSDAIAPILDGNRLAHRIIVQRVATQALAIGDGLLKSSEQVSGTTDASRDLREQTELVRALVYGFNSDRLTPADKEILAKGAPEILSQLLNSSQRTLGALMQRAPETMVSTEPVHPPSIPRPAGYRDVVDRVGEISEVALALHNFMPGNRLVRSVFAEGVASEMLQVGGAVLDSSSGVSLSGARRKPLSDQLEAVKSQISAFQSSGSELERIDATRVVFNGVASLVKQISQIVQEAPPLKIG